MPRQEPIKLPDRFGRVDPSFTTKRPPNPSSHATERRFRDRPHQRKQVVSNHIFSVGCRSGDKIVRSILHQFRGEPWFFGIGQKFGGLLRSLHSEPRFSLIPKFRFGLTCKACNVFFWWLNCSRFFPNRRNFFRSLYGPFGCPLKFFLEH